MNGTRATMVAAAALLVVTSGALAFALAGTDQPSGAAPSTPPTAPVVQLGAPGQPNRTLSPGAPLPSGVTHTEADVAFMRDMVAHHHQALRMTSLTRTNTTHADLAKLAERMDVSQRDEIALMQRWLGQHGTAAPSSPGGHAGHGTTGPPSTTGAAPTHTMPGMLSDAELAQLTAAHGAEFDRLFLQYMIRHHEGAISMVEELLTGGRGGQASDVFLIAQDMSSDQALEVARMKSMLAAG